MDIASMCATSTKVFILEVMGRHAGWIAAAAALAQQSPQQGPHLILLPEVTFDPERFLTKVKQTVDAYGHCVVVASEGIQDATGQFVAAQGTRDAFGHQQLGGVAPTLAQLVTQRWQFKTHWAVSDYLQRSARHIASAVDVEQSYALGQHAIEQALLRQSGVMLTIERLSSTPYRWQIGQVALEKVANVEKKVPEQMIDESGMHITKACRDYIGSLIQGESHPPYVDGLPNYVTLKNKAVKRHLPTLEVV